MLNTTISTNTTGNSKSKVKSVSKVSNNTSTTSNVNSKIHFPILTKLILKYYVDNKIPSVVISSKSDNSKLLKYLKDKVSKLRIKKKEKRLIKIKLEGIQLIQLMLQN